MVFSLVSKLTCIGFGFDIKKEKKNLRQFKWRGVRGDASQVELGPEGEEEKEERGSSKKAGIEREM